MKWGDIDFDRSLLHIRRTAWYGKIQTAKSEASKTVLPIPSSLLTMLKNYQVTWKPNAAGLLFVTRNGRRHLPTKSWNITCGRSSMRWGSRGAVFTHFATHTHRYSLTPAQHPKLFSVNCDTPMLGLR